MRRFKPPYAPEFRNRIELVRGGYGVERQGVVQLSTEPDQARPLFERVLSCSWRQLQAKAKRGNGGKLAAAPGGATPSRLSRPGGQGWPRGRRLLDPGGPLRRASSGSSTRPRRRYGFAAPIFIGLSAGLR
jgi:hypothetical protein